MSVLTNLLRCYEQCEKQGVVDKHNNEDTVLLPIYHQSIKAKKNNILEVTLNTEGSLIRTEFAPDGKVYVFPITEESVARSGKLPPPHPLEDKMQYCIIDIADKDKKEAYFEEFEKFYEFVKNKDVKRFLTSIRKFLYNRENYKEILAKLPYKKVEMKEDGLIVYLNDKDNIVEHDFKPTFLSFQVLGEDKVYRNVSTFLLLHKEFIKYIDEKGADGVDICNISGERGITTEKHRGLMGTAKIISVSNNKETYIGRFKSGKDIIKVGRKTSEKIHLMLKFLLENINSYVHLADSLFLVNWFSGDVLNEANFDITRNDYDYDYDESPVPVSEKNLKITKAFIKGSNKLNDSEKYFLMLVDKSSNGRISIRYYKEMPNSELIKNLELWQQKYIWERYNRNNNNYESWMPSLNEILLTAYGIEREKRLFIDAERFKKDQYQNLVMSLIEGRSVPANIKHALAQNIRNRHCYEKQWNSVLQVSLALLSEGRKEYRCMREKKEQTRSYLYGRLLAIYEKIETDVLYGNSIGDTEGRKGAVIRTTNASRYWNAYANKPDTTMQILDMVIKPYENKMRTSEKLVGAYIKMEKAKQEIIDMLDTNKAYEIRTNDPLNNDFIFGYYAQKKELYMKKETKDE